MAFKFHWWLTRRVEAKKTLVFVVHTDVDMNEEAGGGFISTITDLEPGTVIAAGNTVDEANIAATQMFQDMVDDCLEKGTLPELLGKAKIMEEVNQPVDKVMEAIKNLEERAERAEQRPVRDKWLIGNSMLEGASA